MRLNNKKVSYEKPDDYRQTICRQTLPNPSQFGEKKVKVESNAAQEDLKKKLKFSSPQKLVH